MTGIDNNFGAPKTNPRLPDVGEQSPKAIGFEQSAGKARGSADVITSISQYAQTLTTPLGSAGSSARQNNFSSSTYAEAYQAALSFEVKTKEGDIVSVQLNQNSTYGASHTSSAAFSKQSPTDIYSVIQGLGEASGEASFNHGFAQQSSNQVQFQYRVVGDLSLAEQSAVDSLISGVIETADQFFAGEIEQSVQHVLGLDFDNQALSGFDLQLEQVISQSLTRTNVDLGESTFFESSKQNNGASSRGGIDNQTTLSALGLLEQLRATQQNLIEQVQKQAPRLNIQELAETLLTGIVGGALPLQQAAPSQLQPSQSTIKA